MLYIIFVYIYIYISTYLFVYMHLCVSSMVSCKYPDSLGSSHLLSSLRQWVGQGGHECGAVDKDQCNASHLSRPCHKPAF